MNRLFARYCIMGFLILGATLPGWCQKSGGTGKPGSGSGGSGSTPTNPNPPVSSTPSFQPGSSGPLYVRGRILLDTGQPVTEPVSVALQCGMRPLQVIQSDLKGYFQFSLGGGGAQSNTDFSASDGGSFSPGGVQAVNGQ